MDDQFLNFLQLGIKKTYEIVMLEAGVERSGFGQRASFASSVKPLLTDDTHAFCVSLARENKTKILFGARSDSVGRIGSDLVGPGRTWGPRDPASSSSNSLVLFFTPPCHLPLRRFDAIHSSTYDTK